MPKITERFTPSIAKGHAGSNGKAGRNGQLLVAEPPSDWDDEQPDIGPPSEWFRDEPEPTDYDPPSEWFRDDPPDWPEDAPCNGEPLRLDPNRPPWRSEVELSYDERIRRERAIMEGIPEPVGDFVRLVLPQIYPELELEAKLSELCSLGPDSCSSEKPCNDCLAERRHLHLLAFRETYGPPVHPSDVGGPECGDDPQPVEADDGPKPVEAVDDPHRLARLYVRDRCTHPDGLTLRHWRGEWHRWDGSAYRPVPDKELRADLTVSVKAEIDEQNLIAQAHAKRNGLSPPTAHKVTGRLVADVAHALASLTVLPGRLDPPAWLGGEGPIPVGEALACRNGLVRLPSYAAGKDHFMVGPTPRFFSLSALPFDFDAAAPPPAAWLDFLGRLWPGDSESVETLQEWCGYLLTTDTSQHKILLIVGPRRAGKGTIARVLRALLGPENVVAPTLSGLGTNFGMWPLLGKTLAVIQDARLSGRADVATMIERLLSISGEDAQTVDRKFLLPVTTRLHCRFVIMTNELPRLLDASGALPGRILLLRLTESWYGREEAGLTDRLLAELPGILRWATVGWQRLHERGHFRQPAVGREMIHDLEELASPIGAFVAACCRVGPGYRVERTVLYTRWLQWSAEQGRDRPGDSATFGRDLRAAVPAIRTSQPRCGGGGRVRFYEGIGLR
jgi:putative DNA primase/helicase